MVQQEILESMTDENLSVFVVWTPVLQEDSRRAAADAMQLIPDQRVVHFWDADKSLGFSAGKAVTLPRERELAWDVYFVFDPESKWENTLPTPDYWMHQLAKDERTLDGEKLHTTIDMLLNKDSE